VAVHQNGGEYTKEPFFVEKFAALPSRNWFLKNAKWVVLDFPSDKPLSVGRVKNPLLVCDDVNDKSG